MASGIDSLLVDSSPARPYQKAVGGRLPRGLFYAPTGTIRFDDRIEPHA